MERKSSPTLPGSASAADKRHHSRGQSMVEFAVFLPVLMLILLVAVDVGRLFMGYVTIQNMARIGANYAAVNAAAWDAPDTSAKQLQRARYRTLMDSDRRVPPPPQTDPMGCPDLASLPAPVFVPDTSFGSNVRVTIECDFPLITPFLNLVFPGQIMNVAATTNFTVRTGSVDVGSPGGGQLPPTQPPVTAPPTAVPTASPTPTPPPTPTPFVSLDPGATAPPTAVPPTAQPTVPPVTVSFYGTTTAIDSEGGGPSPSPGFENIVGIPVLPVEFSNTTTGVQWTCLWDFGDGTTSDSCGSMVVKNYSVRGTYHVTLTVNSQTLVRPGYVLVGCKVPSFSGSRANAAVSTWTGAGFVAGNLSKLDNGNFIVGYQSLAGGLLNPPGGCAGAQISIGGAE